MAARGRARCSALVGAVIVATLSLDVQRLIWQQCAGPAFAASRASINRVTAKRDSALTAGFRLGEQHAPLTARSASYGFASKVWPGQDDESLPIRPAAESDQEQEEDEEIDVDPVLWDKVQGRIGLVWDLKDPFKKEWLDNTDLMCLLDEQIRGMIGTENCFELAEDMRRIVDDEGEGKGMTKETFLGLAGAYVYDVLEDQQAEFRRANLADLERD